MALGDGVSEPEHGGQAFPADLWGKAPLRGEAVRQVDAFLAWAGAHREFWTAGDLVDHLIHNGVLPDEQDWREAL